MAKLKALLCLLAALAIIAIGVTQSAFADPSTSRSTSVNLSSSSQTFVSFSQFLTNVATARFTDYAGLATTRVQNQQAFGAMQAYIINMYVGVKQVSSFVLDGQYYDCITVSSQPSVRLLHIKHIAQPPSVSVQAVSDSSLRMSESSLTLGLKDQFGNSISCADGTIPMQRITLENMVQFPTVRDFLSKGPGAQIPVNGRSYAEGYQYVANHGGGSFLNIWNPSGYFSISQQWYIGGSGSGLQTVEGGWIHYAGFNSKSVLFIYWTGDDYHSTGCYNLCGAFVEINKTWPIGGPFSAYSTYGGTQYGIRMQWYFFQGNWWLYLPISGSMQPIGYYPGSLYKGGALSEGKSDLIEFGGETATTTNLLWPQMGSGKFASAGWQQAAFQNNAFYITSTGNSTLAATLSPYDINPSCTSYTINITSNSGTSWGTYFYFGGPGGARC